MFYLSRKTRTISVVLALIMMIAMFSCPVAVKAVSQSEAIEWCVNRIGWQIEYNDWSAPYQCFDFVAQYAHDLFGTSGFGVGLGAAANLQYYYPNGWTNIQGNSNIQTGDVFVTAWAPYGHTGIVESVSNGRVHVIDQNGFATQRVARSDYAISTIVAVLRPPLDSEPTSPPPKPGNVRGEKKAYSTSEYITLYWDTSSGATHYYAYLWKDGKELYGVNMGNQTNFTSAPTSAGNYTLIVRAGNSIGYSGGNEYSFTVYDKKPNNPQIYSDKKLYTALETIKFTWDSVPIATHYWVYLWKDGKELYGINVGNQTNFTSAPTSAGNYTLIVRAGNNFGYGDNGAQYGFTVYDSPPSAPVVSMNKTNYLAGEEIKFYFSTKNTTNEAVCINKRVDDKWQRIVTQYLPKSSPFGYVINDPGSYMIYLYTVNEYGLTDSEALYFTVDDIPPSTCSSVSKEGDNYNFSIDIANPMSDSTCIIATYTNKGELVEVKTISTTSTITNIPISMSKSEGATNAKVLM